MRRLLLLLLLLLPACATPAPAPAPPPPPPIERVLPLVGDVNARDADGYPTAYVDGAALQALLRAGNYTALTAALEAAQARFEEDWRFEYWAHDSVEGFTADAAFEPLFDAWVAASPTSFAPLAARGAWRCDMGLAARGDKYIHNTKPEQLAKMRAWHERGVADLQRALTLRPRAVSVARVLVVLGTRSGELVDVEQVTQQALVRCPNCLHVRVAAMVNLMPKWGGSHGLMGAFAALALRGTTNKKLECLAGYVAYDRAMSSRDRNEQRRLLDEAIAHGDAADFYRERGELRGYQRDDGGALADFRKVVALRPAVGTNHATLAIRLAEQKDWQNAEQEMRIAVGLDSEGVKAQQQQLLQKLRQQARDPFAPRELLGVLASLETKPERAEELRRRSNGWSTLIIPVNEPPEWQQAPPPPSQLVPLLDAVETREAAWCRLLERAIRGEGQGRRTSSFAGARCELESVESAPALDGTLLRLLLPRSTEQQLPGGGLLQRPLFIVAADGSVTKRVLGQDSSLAALGAQKAVVAFSAMPAGPGKRTVLLQVDVVDAASHPSLRVVLGGPQPNPPPPNSPADFAAVLASATAPLVVRARDDKLELLTRDAKPKTVAVYVFDAKKKEWRGPAGTKKQRFLRLVSDGEKTTQAQLEEWNTSFDPCATQKQKEECSAPPRAFAPSRGDAEDTL